jgi:hypothetical protein
VSGTSFTAALLGALIVQLALACGPAQHPCVTAYEMARTEAEIAEVDKVCEHMLLTPVGSGGLTVGGGGQGGGK